MTHHQRNKLIDFGRLHPRECRWEVVFLQELEVSWRQQRGGRSRKMGHCVASGADEVENAFVHMAENVFPATVRFFHYRVKHVRGKPFREDGCREVELIDDELPDDDIM